MIFCRSFFVSQYPKFHRGTLLCFKNFLILKNIMDKRGSWSITIFRPNFFVAQCR